MHWDWNWNWDWDADWNLNEWQIGHSHNDWHWNLLPFSRFQSPFRHCHLFPSLLDMDKEFCHSDCWMMSTDWCHRSCLTGRVCIESGEEEGSYPKGTFKILLDAHHFHVDELQLKVRNNDTIIIEGRLNDERITNKSRNLCVTRAFKRRYRLPRNYDATLAKASFSKDGILTVIVPPPPPLDDTERTVDIVETNCYYGTKDANTAIKDE